jgi:hypothetical protein
MWMRTKSGWYYPKYPFGTSLMNAITVLLGEREWAFAISPACTTVALLEMFFLARPIVGSFYALLAMAPSVMPDNGILPWHPEVRAMFEIRNGTKQAPTTSVVGLH